MEKIISDYIKDQYSALKEIRRKIHSNPELSNDEIETTNTIEKFLSKHGIKFMRFKNVQGGCVFIDNKKESSIAYRADIDALPITEKTNCNCSSKNKGVMHACGHDIHTTIALGLCLVLNNFKEKLDNNFIIIFQPAEENNPIGGSKDVINEGIFNEYNIKEIYGAHCWPKYKVGDVLVRQGTQQASSNKFVAHIEGKNSHAAEPHLGIDAINISIQFIDYALNKLRREISPNDVCVVSIGKMESTGRYNVISSNVTIEGTIRSSNDEVKNLIFDRLNSYIRVLNEFYGTNSTIEIADGYGPVINDRDLVRKFIEKQSNYNDINIISDFNMSLIAEDFYAYRKVAKSMFAFLGCGVDESLHSDKFLPDEDLIYFGVLAFARYFILWYI